MQWLDDPSERSVRHALAVAVPALADASIELATDIGTSNPQWASSTAVVDGAFVVKFAWSEQAAMRVNREARLLEAIPQVADVPVPRLEGASDAPVAFVTPLIRGKPLGFEDVRSARSGDREAMADQLASFLARLHEPRVLELAHNVATLVAPRPQGNTSAIRARLGSFLDPIRIGRVEEWCDWVDTVLSRPAPQPVLVHGDLHGYNQVWDHDRWALALVADFEVAGPSDPEYDFRYFPSQDQTLDFVSAIRLAYGGRTGRTIEMDRVMAWHILTALGDALWRSEAGIPLPGGSTPATYVDDIASKLDRV
jgi:aminoglycoside phosphotransferase (APT) family kinase protein